MPEGTGESTNLLGESQTQTESKPTSTTIIEEQKTFADFIGESGELKEGWKNHFLPEDLRTEKIYDVIKDLPSAFKTLGHQAKLVGRKGILLPTEASGESEWDAFYEAVGRPKTVGDYNYQAPDDIDIADLSPESVKESLSLVHEAGFTQKQFDIGKQILQDTLRGIQKATDDFEERDKSEAETALRNKWGTAYDENLHLVNRMISENSEAGEEMDYLIAEYGNNPRLANFLGKIAKKFIEHRIITDIETPSAAADEKIKELMNSKPYLDRMHSDHKAVVQQVQNLFVEQAKRKAAGQTVTSP